MFEEEYVIHTRKGTAVITGTVNEVAVRTAIKAAGYKVKKIETKG